MKRIGIVGLCLVAVLALGAVVSSSAFAAEYGVCVKAAKEGRKSTGRYTNKKCTSESAKKDGGYEWYAGRSGIGRPGVSAEDFESLSSSKAAVLSSAAGEIACRASAGVGRITGPTSDEETTTFTGCLTSTGQRCGELSEFDHETGQIHNADITVYSATELIDHGETGPSGDEPASGEVWNAFSPLEGSPVYPYQALFICEPGVLFRMSGSVSGVYKSSDLNKMSDKGEIAFGAGIGEQDLNTEFSENGGETWASTGPTVESVTASTVTKDKSKIEIRAG